MPTSTYARSTRKRTLARAESGRFAALDGRLLTGAAIFILVAIVSGACDDSDGDGSTPTAPPAVASPAAPATPSPDPLAERIGPRADLPDADAIDLADRYGITDGRAPASKPFAGEHDVGDLREFLVMRISGDALAQLVPPELVTINATLRARSEHAYLFIDDALDVGDGDAEAALDQFEASAWPRVTTVFGTPDTPGVDGDPRVIILQADLGGAVGGYHNGDDLYLKQVRPHSNEAEIVYIDRTLRTGGDAFNVVVAHELQHLVHSYNDAGEEAWVNEGLSETAAGLAGGAMSSINAFSARPDTQLNRWSQQGSSAHYGASAAYFEYLAGRFGGDAVLGEIAQEDGDGPAGVDQFLQGVGPVAFAQTYADWVAANLLNRIEGPYGNPRRQLDVQVEGALSPGQTVEDSATQFGVDYFELEDLGPGEHIIRFDGAPRVAVLPVAVEEGMYWANAGDGINTRLTIDLDVPSTGDATLRFRTWFDVERWYDWGYLSVSTDGGVSWEALSTAHTSIEDPVGAAYGPGFSGRSGGGEAAVWVDDEVDLSDLAGETVQLRFEYVTDGSTHGEGWIVDDVAFGGRSVDLAAAESAGWTAIDGDLPQSYSVRLIAETADGAPVVLDVPLDTAGNGELRFAGAGMVGPVLAVSGLTEGTNQESAYTLELRAP